MQILLDLGICKECRQDFTLDDDDKEFCSDSCELNYQEAHMAENDVFDEFDDEDDEE